MQPQKASLIIAADISKGETNDDAIISQFTGLPVWIKIGLELFVSTGAIYVKKIVEQGFSVFLDLKFHDIPNTVSQAVKNGALTGAGMMTLHVAGGEAMAHAALEGRRQAYKFSSYGEPLLLGVTVLTSVHPDELGCTKEELQKRTVDLALLAKSYGLNGVICSGHEVGLIKEKCGSDFVCVCPGIRFDDGEVNDQARVCSPTEAVKNGADYIVMGRPILSCFDPVVAANKVLTMINGCK